MLGGSIVQAIHTTTRWLPIRLDILGSVLGAILGLVAGRAEAGCGCDKPPPPVASVRPAFASPGYPVTVFHPSLVDGVMYAVDFVQGAEVTTVDVTADTRRDYADASYKPQLTVIAPQLDPGPTRIVVRLASATVQDIPATDFTMLQRPIAVPAGSTVLKVTHYQAAVGADGTLYLPLDLSAVTARTVFTGLGKGGFRFLFGAEDVSIYNVQGILMEMLFSSTAPHQIDDGSADPSTDDDESGAASSRLAYDRHEFQTYRRRHVTEADWLLDPDDLAWHTDGSRHIDHDHIILAITGHLNGSLSSGSGNGNRLAQGATQQFTLKLSTVEPDDATEPVVSARIAWNDTATTSTTVVSTTSTVSTSTATTTSTTLPGGNPCDATGAGVQLACLCEGETLAACTGDDVPRSVAGPLRTACRLLARSVEEEGDLVSYCQARAALHLQRARTALGRGRVARRVSSECAAALANALDFKLP